MARRRTPIDRERSASSDAGAAVHCESAVTLAVSIRLLVSRMVQRTRVKFARVSTVPRLCSFAIETAQSHDSIVIMQCHKTHANIIADTY
jgi:hypothetical protein